MTSSQASLISALIEISVPDRRAAFVSTALRVNDCWSEYAKQKFSYNSSLTVNILPPKQNVVASILFVRSIVLRRRLAEMDVAAPDLAKIKRELVDGTHLHFVGEPEPIGRPKFVRCTTSDATP